MKSNDLNSVLIEGTVVAIQTQPTDNRLASLDLKSYRKPAKGSKTPTSITCHVTLDSCESHCLAEVSEGRTVRIVGRLHKYSRRLIGIMADHVELKPLPVG
jgi:hypothetical protein